MKKQLFSLFAALLLCSFAWAEVLEIPISLDLTTGGQYSIISGSVAGEDTTLETTGTDPRVNTSLFSTEYMPNATDKITFQYKSDAEIPHIQVFFSGVAGTPTATKSVTTSPVTAAAEWTTYEIVVGQHASWGLYPMFRFDFGNLSGITISIRDIKLLTSTIEKNRVEFFYPMNETFLYGAEAASGSVNAKYVPTAGANNITFVADDSRGAVLNNPAGNVAVNDVSCLETVGLTKGANNSDATYGAWIKLMPGASSVMQIVMSTAPSGATVYRNILNVRYNATYSAARLESTLGTAGMINDEDFNIIPGEWTHIAVSSDNTTKRQKLYINGDSVFTAVLDDFASMGEVRVGCHANITGAGASQTLTGQMDDVFMYSRVLSSAEIKALCDNGTMPTSNCEFMYDFEDATSGPVPSDGPIASIYRPSSVEVNNYTSLDNDHSDEEGNNALAVPSSNITADDVACVETNGLFNGSYNSDATYGMWVKPTAGETRPLQVLMSGVGGKTILALRPTEAPNEGQLTLESSCDATAGLTFSVSSAPLDFDQWNHVALVTKTDGTIEFYINGILKSHTLINSYDGNLTPSGYATFSELRIGAHPNLAGGSGQSFSGLMDDAFMYSKALDSSAIKTLAGISDYATLLKTMSEEGISVYPCPVMEGHQVMIARPARLEGQVEVTIYSLNGRPIYRSQSMQTNIAVDMHLTAGQYVVKLSSQSASYTQPFIVK